MAPPEHRLKGPLRGSGTSGGAVMPQPKHCGKGTGSTAGSGEIAGCGGGMGSRGANPLRNLSNLAGHRGSRKEPSTTFTPAATSQPRVARPGSSSSPRDSSLRTGQKQKSYSCHGRFSLLCINSLDSTSALPDPGGSTIHLSNTALGGAAESAARLAPMESSRLTVRAGAGLSIKTPRKHQAVSLNVETPPEHQAAVKGSHQAAVKGSSGETPRKHQTVAGYKVVQKHCIKEKTGERTLPSRRVLHPLGIQRADTMDGCITRQKQSGSNPSISSDTCTGRSSVSNNNAIAHHCKEPAADNKIHLPEEVMKQVQEADLVIQQLNESGLGEDISDEELQHYYEQLSCEHTCVDTSLELSDEQIKKLQVNHVLYRIKYYKMTQERRKKELASILEYDCYRYRLEEKLKCFLEDETKLKKDHFLDHLDKEGLLEYIEKDDTFDWFFQHRTVAALDDYQRLVPRDRGCSEYVHWHDYREYFHKYEIEREYLLFWKELLKKLKWMEDYLNVERSTLKWGRVNKRGESQAIKIATGFTKITICLAHVAYYECIDYMSTEFHQYRELDGVYFEIWKRVAKLEMSFREALDDVYKSGKFLLRQHEMEHALEVSNFEMEEEFCYCTEAIAEEDTEEKARELIADAIQKMLRRPKFYAQYIMKKMEVATAIGVIPQGPP